MSDVVTTLRTLLLEAPDVFAITGDRWYPMQMPDAPLFPLGVIMKVGAPGEYDFQGDAGIEQARVQIDLYSDSGYGDLMDLRLAVRRALSGFPQDGVSPDSSTCEIDSCMVISDMDRPANEFEQAGPRHLRRRMLEFYVWNRGI
ncbi:MAG: hypothetical protein CMB99_16500 [Flavobacteriaceae bacterium]|jgi:hypothetical protein|nr:hypothetical protein [Flavobacteriaceae bacterium]|tara:strand:+ start:4753 stop:5184 length:432 start_codon:yes stop_codon:yes gene_type:complete